MMSNLVFPLAQTTQAVSDGATIKAFTMLIWGAWAFASVWMVARRNLTAIGTIPRTPPQANTVVLLGVLLSAVAAYYAVGAICIGYWHLTPESLTTIAGERQAVMCQPLSQIAAAVAISGMLAMVGAMPRGLQWKKASLGDVGRGVMACLLAFPWVMVTGFVVDTLATRMGEKASRQHQIFDIWNAEPAGMTPFKAVAFFSAVVAAPLAEELVFRGLLQRVLQQALGLPVVAIVLTSLAFASIHQPWTLQPPVFVLSLVLGWAYFRSGSIVVPMVAHAVFNATQFGLFAATSGN